MANEPPIEPDQKLEALLSRTLPAASPADEAHYELDELTHLAEARRAQGEAWEMPAHLSRCGWCLEAFQAILEGVAAVSADALQRFVGVGKTGMDQPTGAREEKVVPFPSPWKLVFKIAAVAAVLFVAFVFMTRTTPVRVSGGTVALQDGKRLPQGATIPSDVTVTATEDVSASLADGSTIELTKDTQVSFGKTSVTLTAGKLVASVAKQPAGRQFIVKTPLGDVVVVGTRFTVTSAAEDVVVYESAAGQTRQRPAVVQAVRVAVLEGIVRVKRQGEQVNVVANQTAVLRENEPGIEVQ